MKRKDLNSVKLNYAYLHSPDYNEQKSQKDNSESIEDKMLVESFFKDLDKALIKKINEADAVVGCVAWMTHYGILDALAACKNGVSIILQKEDFLRPDYGSTDSFRLKLQEKYSNLEPIDNWGESSFRKKAEYLGFSLNDNWHEDASQWLDISMRCVGYLKGNKEFTLPRMHHKFLVFCKYIKDYGAGVHNYVPYAVWTGSFNMTLNGTKSLENAVYIQNEKLAKSFYGEWFNMLMISEDLDWSSEWIEPDIHRLDECSVIS